MAHELGHVVYRHGAKHVSRAMGWDLVQKILLGDQSGEAAELVTTVVAQGVMLKNGRGDELEADSLAIPTLIAADYDPRGVVTFFQKLIDRYGDSGGGLASFFSSHPATSERIARSEELIQAVADPGARNRPIADLRRVQATLRGEIELCGTAAPGCDSE
jgi:predicted Zn-dependent protease